MMRSLSVLLLGLAFGGVALEMASPLVLFPTDSLIILTEPDESAPIVKPVPLGIAVPVEWQKMALQDGRIRWVANLAGQLSEGVWQISTNKTTWTFLVVSPLFSVVEILSQSEALVTVVTSTGETYSGWAAPSQPLTFIIQPACPGTEAWITVPSGNQNLFHCERILLYPSGRVRLALPSFRIISAAREVLPGMSFVVGLAASGLSKLLDILLAPETSVKIELPAGWKATFLPQDGRGHFTASFVPWLLVSVPSDANLGTYQLKITIRDQKNPDFVARLEGEVLVTDELSPKEVVGHWNVAEGDLELSRPYAITYDRLLWAASLVGQAIPYSGATMTQELLEELAREWLSSSQ